MAGHERHLDLLVERWAPIYDVLLAEIEALLDRLAGAGMLDSSAVVISTIRRLYGALAGRELPDAVITDLHMPEVDGFGVLEGMQALDPRVPVLMLTSRGDETDRIVGLEIGADDYLPKTFSTRELLARLRESSGLLPPWRPAEQEP